MGQWQEGTNFTPLCLFVRKLIEGEDSRLSTMVRNLSLTGGLHLTSSASTRAASASASASDSSAPAATLKLDEAPSDTSSGGAEKAPDAGDAQVEAASLDTQKDLEEEQATEMTERKTVLIR